MKLLKYNYIKIFFASVLFLLTTGCDEYLSELPDNRTEIDSPEKIDALLTGAYPTANYSLMGELMSDNALSKNTTNNVVNPLLAENMFNWETSNDDNQDTPNFYWSACYSAIAQANQALKSIEELQGDYDLKASKGEALLARAYAHFMLVNFWGKHYSSSSTSDLGVPYVTEPETVLIAQYKRNTVAEVYDLIEKDLLEGLDLVQTKDRNGKFHFSKESGYAFATRFYLYKGDWDNTIKYANLILTSATDEIRDEIEYSGLSYDERALRYGSSIERSNLLIVSTTSWWARTFATTNYGLVSGSLIFNDSNNPFSKEWAYGVFGGEEFANRPKYEEYQRFTNQSSGEFLGYTPVVLFGKDEVLLNRAEAYAMKGNYTNSISDLTSFLSLRTINFDPITDVLTQSMIETQYPFVANELTPNYTMDNTQTSFVKAILDLKQKEFYHEGMRWFDVRRFNIKIVRDFIKGGTSTEITLEKNDNRLQLQIPQSALDFGLTPNPR